MTLRAVLADSLFDGASVRPNTAVLVEDARILAVVPDADLPASVPLFRPDGGAILAPALIDAQVNGGGGVLFNDAIDHDGLLTIARAHRACGTGFLLPTLVSGSTRAIAAALDAVRAAITAPIPGILGLHVEGPFINIRRRGIHPERAIRPLTAIDLGLLGAPFPAPLVLTLAPEMISPETLSALHGGGVVILAGHTEATAEEVERARAAGLSGFTHLFNAMPPLSARAPGPAGAALADKDAFASLIVDGRHVHSAMLRAAIRAKGSEHIFLVSDAMPTVGSSRTSFRIGEATIRLAEGRLTDATGTLAGAHLSLAEAVRNAHQLLGLSVADALRMATSVPARCLGVADRLGAVRPGMAAEFAIFDRTLTLIGTWSDGAYAPRPPPAPASQASTSPAFRSGGNTG